MRAVVKSREMLIGALLRVPAQAIHRRIIVGLNAAGFGDLKLPHMAALQFPGPDGVRPGVLAERAGASKQAMNQLLGSLERLGYITRSGRAGRGARAYRPLYEAGARGVGQAHEILRDDRGGSGARRSGPGISRSSSRCCSACGRAVGPLAGNRVAQDGHVVADAAAEDEHVPHGVSVPQSFPGVEQRARCVQEATGDEPDDGPGAQVIEGGLGDDYPHPSHCDIQQRGGTR